MDASRNADLVEMARDAAIERSDFLVRAGEQLERFMAANADRIRDLGGLVLIDDDPDYLAVSPDGTFRSRSRVYDESSGEWVSETEVIEMLLTEGEKPPRRLPTPPMRLLSGLSAAMVLPNLAPAAKAWPACPMKVLVLAKVEKKARDTTQPGISRRAM